MALNILSIEEYQQHAEKQVERSFLQTEEMAQLLQKRGMTVQRIGLVKNNEIRVAGLLYSIPMTGGLHMEINGGPSTLYPEDLAEFYSLLKDYAKENGALQLIVKPYQTYQSFDSNGEPISQQKEQLLSDLTKSGYQFDGLKTGYPGGEPDWHYVKDLAGLTKDTLRKSFSKKGRPLANKTASFGITTKKLNRDELVIFKEITEATSERREYEDKPLDYYEAFYDSFGDNCEFMIASINFKDYHTIIDAEHKQIQAELDAIAEKIAQGVNSAKVNTQQAQLQKKILTFEQRLHEANDLVEKYGDQDVTLAGSLFIYTPQETVYLFSGSYPEFNKFYAPVALQEYVMQESIRRGISFYTLLGVQGIFDGSDGVLRFKQNFNGYIVRKMGTFRYYPNPIKYKLLQGIKKLLGRN
ncbi:aminoacyltransferase [Streptococcus cameli]